MGDGPLEAMGAIDRNPGVVGSPHDVHRLVDLAVPRFDVVGEAFGCLRDLPYERSPSRIRRPRFDEHREVLIPQAARTRTPDIGFDHAAMDGGRDLLENLGVISHETEEGRTPRREGDNIHEPQRGVASPMAQSSPQRDRTADVVRDNARPLETPVIQQRREQLGLHTDVDSMIRMHRRLSVSGHVPQVDGVGSRERVCDRTPQL